MNQKLKTYCVTYEFNGRKYWQNVKAKSPKAVKLKGVKILTVEPA